MRKIAVAKGLRIQKKTLLLVLAVRFESVPVVMQGKTASRPKSIFQIIYDWIDSCDLPNFDIVFLTISVFVGGLLFLAFVFALRHVENHRSNQPALAFLANSLNHGHPDHPFGISQMHPLATNKNDESGSYTSQAGSAASWAK